MKKLLFVLPLMLLSLFTFAGDEDSTKIFEERKRAILDSIHKTMKWETGNIKISNDAVDLKIPAGFKFLGAEQSQYVLEDLWGNMKDNTVLGMIFPSHLNPLDDSAWAFVVTFDNMGYVKDTDADDIKYDDLLKQLKEDSKKANEERIKLGMSQFDLIGWAQKPYYDKTNKVLHWAKEYKSSDATENTLNYDVRILGRKGVLSLNAVARMSQLPEVKNNIDDVLKIPSFTEGNRYSDFNPDVDKVAAWTIGGLVAGKLLAKVGIFAVLAKYLKLIIIGGAALVGGLWKWISGRRKKNEELQAAQEQNAEVPGA